MKSDWCPAGTCPIQKSAVLLFLMYSHESKPYIFNILQQFIFHTILGGKVKQFYTLLLINSAAHVIPEANRFRNKDTCNTTLCTIKGEHHRHMLLIQLSTINMYTKCTLSIIYSYWLCAVFGSTQAETRGGPRETQKRCDGT